MCESSHGETVLNITDPEPCTAQRRCSSNSSFSVLMTSQKVETALESLELCCSAALSVVVEIWICTVVVSNYMWLLST